MLFIFLVKKHYILCSVKSPPNFTDKYLDLFLFLPEQRHTRLYPSANCLLFWYNFVNAFTLKDCFKSSQLIDYGQLSIHLVNSGGDGDILITQIYRLQLTFLGCNNIHLQSMKSPISIPLCPNTNTKIAWSKIFRRHWGKTYLWWNN